MSGARHLYVHLPFCAHRCGYCDFVTVVGRRGQHAAYVDALLRELELERAVLANELETVFLGGGTPTFTALPELLRLLAALPAAEEVTVEANPAERRQIQPDQPTVLGGAEDHQIHRVLGVGLNAGIHGVPRDTGVAAGGLPRRRQRRFESFDEGHCQFVAAGGDHAGRPWTGGQR